MKLYDVYESKDTKKIFQYYRSKYFILIKEIGEEEFNSMLDESFLRAFRKFDTSHKSANFGKFLCGSIQLNINNMLRTRGYDWYKIEHDMLSLNRVLSVEDNTPTEFVDTLENTTNDYSKIEIKDTLEYIKNNVGLTEEEMLVLTLHVVHGLKCSEIERIYGINYTKLSATCRRIKNRMKKDKEFMEEVINLCIS